MLRSWGSVSIALLLAGTTFADLRPRRDFILTETEAIGVLPPEVVSVGDVKSAKWSSDGQYLLILRQRDNMAGDAIKAVLEGNPQSSVPSQELVLWNARTHKSSVAFASNADAGTLAQFDWLVGSQTAIVTHDLMPSDQEGAHAVTRRLEILLLTAPNGRVRPIVQPGEGEQVTMSVSPTKPLAVIQVYTVPPLPVRQPGTPVELRPVTSMYQLIGPSGPQGKRVTGVGMVTPAFSYGWTPDGTNCYAQGMAPKKDGAGFRNVWYALDFAAGSAQEAFRPQLYKAPAPSKTALQPAGSQARLTLQDLSADVQSLWLMSPVKSDLPGCLVCADVSAAEISPAGDGIFYVSQGVGYVRPMIRLPKDQFLKALEAADRTELMNKTKQAAVALLMYSSDNNDWFPAKEADIMSTLMPYVKDRSVLEGFVYTFPGGDISKVESPASTEIGYMPGPGGRAVAYADGHVKWVNDNP